MFRAVAERLYSLSQDRPDDLTFTTMKLCAKMSDVSSRSAGRAEHEDG